MKATKTFLITCSALITITATLYFFQFKYNQTVESITYFPLDTEAQFLDAKTKIMNIKTNQNHYQFSVESYSRLDRAAFLRQDIALIFASGILIGKLGEWEESTDSLELSGTFFEKDNQIVRALSFHYAELHSKGTITSSQKMSDDFLYIIPTALPSLVSFHTPSNEEETGWKEVLDKKENQIISKNLKEAIRQLNIDLAEFYIIPLPRLANYQKQPLPSFSKQKSDEIIGQLWEGLYKNYYLGIRKQNGQLIPPIGSTLPIILLSKTKQYLYVIFQTADNEFISLKQQINHERFGK